MSCGDVSIAGMFSKSATGIGVLLGHVGKQFYLYFSS